MSAVTRPAGSAAVTARTIAACWARGVITTTVPSPVISCSWATTAATAANAASSSVGNGVASGS